MDATWRHQQRDALIDFAENAVVPAGFGYLDAYGHHQPDHGVELWINGRFTHVMACEVLRGNRDAMRLLDHGMRALNGPLHDAAYDGWFRSVSVGVSVDGSGPFGPGEDMKEAYSHAFVVLAASSALQAGHPDAQPLLERALACSNKYWWQPEYGRVQERANRDWSQFEDYRGINANMHTVESYLAVFDATGDPEYLERALNICQFVMEGARERNWRILEHYSGTWEPDPDFNQDHPADPFRPYGATVGHAFEWARLCIQARIMAMRNGLGVADLYAPLALIRQGIADGWAVDGAAGFIYTTDFAGKPITHERMHWVVCEALNAVHVARLAIDEVRSASASPFTSPLGAVELARWEETWWEYAYAYLIESPGRWLEELDQDNHLSERTWKGMPEIYHAYQALVLADGDYAGGFAKAAAASASSANQAVNHMDM